MTVQSSIFLSLLDHIPDRELRDKLRDQYFHDVEAQTSFVQTRIGQLELDLRDQVTQSLGNTNEMIGEVLAISRRQEAAQTTLRGEFLAVAEKVNQHDQEIASFRVSRDQSIRERQQLQDDLAESKTDRAAIHQELQDAKGERHAMSGQLAEILAMLSGRPSNEEAQQLVAIIHETVKRVAALEERERSSNET